MTQQMIMNCISEKPMTARELSKKLGISMNTIFQYIARLRKKQVIDFCEVMTINKRTARKYYPKVR